MSVCLIFELVMTCCMCRLWRIRSRCLDLTLNPKPGGPSALSSRNRSSNFPSRVCAFSVCSDSAEDGRRGRGNEPGPHQRLHQALRRCLQAGRCGGVGGWRAAAASMRGARSKGGGERQTGCFRRRQSDQSQPLALFLCPAPPARRPPFVGGRRAGLACGRPVDQHAGRGGLGHAVSAGRAMGGGREEGDGWKWAETRTFGSVHADPSYVH